MPDFERKAAAVWHGDLRDGNGTINASSGLFKDAAYSFSTRFENNPGTNPEELIAAAQAACFSMAFANQLSKRGFKVDNIDTTATCHLSNASGGYKIVKMSLDVKGKVEGIDVATFKQVAQETDEQHCPVSLLLHPGTQIEVNAELVN
jgi:osmotically inducible protein OsmC